MSTRSYLRHRAAQTFALLLSFVLSTGCGMTGRNHLADDAGPDAILDIVVDDGDAAVGNATRGSEHTGRLADRQVAASNNRSTSAADLLDAPDPATAPVENYVTQRALFRSPDEATIDMPPIPLGPVMPVSSRANLLKREQLPEAPPTPELAEQAEQSTDEAADPAEPAPVVTVQPAPPVSRTVDRVSTETFQQEVLESDIPVLVDFYADWCGPCKLLAPMLDQVAREQDGLRIVKVNIDDDEQLKKRYRVQSIPTVMIFSEGKMVVRQTGLPAIQKSLGR